MGHELNIPTGKPGSDERRGHDEQFREEFLRKRAKVEKLAQPRPLERRELDKVEEARYIVASYLESAGHTEASMRVRNFSIKERTVVTFGISHASIKNPRQGPYLQTFPAAVYESGELLIDSQTLQGSDC